MQRDPKKDWKIVMSFIIFLNNSFELKNVIKSKIRCPIYMSSYKFIYAPLYICPAVYMLGIIL